MKISRRRLIVDATALVALVAVAAGLIYWQYHRTHQTTAVTAKPTNQTTSTPKVVAQPLDRMTIEAMKAKSYPGSALTTEQNLGEQSGYRTSVVSYQSDGLTIHALMSVPDGVAPTAGWPVVILEHGYELPSSYKTVSSEYLEFIRTFAQAGYVVIKPDFRGHGTSQGEAEGGHFSPVYAYDVLNLVASLKQTKTIDSRRIGQFGHSMGGHEALRAAVVSPDIKATVLMAGVVGSFNDIFYNWPHSPAPNDQPTTLTRSKTQALVDAYGYPKDNPTFWNSVSAVTYVGNITGAVQINHDTGDSTVPVLFAQHLRDALQAAHKSVDYREYPGDDHQFIANRKAILANALAFYKANL